LFEKNKDARSIRARKIDKKKLRPNSKIADNNRFEKLFRE
jgi:hypothetical protein